MSSDEWFLFLYNLIDTIVGMEVCLNIREYDDGAISTSTTIKFRKH